MALITWTKPFFPVQAGAGFRKSVGHLENRPMFTDGTKKQKSLSSQDTFFSPLKIPRFLYRGLSHTCFLIKTKWHTDPTIREHLPLVWLDVWAFEW